MKIKTWTVVSDDTGATDYLMLEPEEDECFYQHDKHVRFILQEPHEDGMQQLLLRFNHLYLLFMCVDLPAEDAKTVILSHFGKCEFKLPEDIDNSVNKAQCDMEIYYER